MSDRKLVTVRTIDNVRKHPNADRLFLLDIGGWQCVTAHPDYQPGDKAVYIEIDSFVPVDREAFAFLEKDAITYEGIRGARIRTIKLRKEISQGLVLPLSELGVENPVEDVDYSEALGVIKWEPKLPAQLGGQAKGYVPSWIRKTDQERIQNIFNTFGNVDDKFIVEYIHPETNEKIMVERAYKNVKDTDYEVSIKLDGSSATFYIRDGQFGVCSRNLDLEESEGNAFWQIARKLNLEERLRAYGENIALQGELVGPSIQGNNEKVTENEFYLFDIWDIDSQSYLDSYKRRSVLAYLNSQVGVLDEHEIKHIPILGIHHFSFNAVGDVLEAAEGPSMNPGAIREGIVFKRIDDPNVSFKAISNAYLLKHGDR